MAKNLKVEEKYQKFGFKLTPTIRYKGPFKTALKVMKKARSMVKLKDFFTLGSATGITYWITEDPN